MKSKYYTPSIEEFHVGFEYEVMIPEKEIWSKEIFYLNRGHINLVEYVNIQNEFTKNKIRVKYLSREDIESLGFKYDNDSNSFKIYNTYEIIELIKRDDNINISKTLQTKMVAKVLPISEWKEFNVFNGTIKNKSELKVLLKQLSIK